jgi:adenylate cyclase
VVEDQARGFTLGAAEYLVKPIERQRLRAVLHRHLGAHGRILLIEDDEAVREATRALVRQNGFSVDEAADGREALERVGAAAPDLILLDLMMPGMDGFEFLGELRRRPEWHGIPVVVLTAKDLTRDDLERLNGRVARVLQKAAVSRAQLLAELREVIRAAGGPAARPGPVTAAGG